MLQTKKASKLCCEPGCTNSLVVYGRCTKHFRALDPDLAARLRQMSRAERNMEIEKAARQSKFPKWEFRNDEGEAELAEKAAQKGQKQ